MKDILVTFPGGKRVDAEYKGFKVKTDQPVYQGGEGSEPAPFDLFLISIATCSGIYIVYFCEKRGIPFEDASVVMKIEKDKDTKKIVKFIIEVNLPPGFPDRYTKAILKAVDTCAVKAYILDPPEFEIKAVRKEDN